jgi:hypothetical protein
MFSAFVFSYLGGGIVNTKEKLYLHSMCCGECRRVVRQNSISISQGEKQQNLAEPLKKIGSGGFYIFSILGTSSHHFWMITSKIGGGKFFYSHLFTSLYNLFCTSKL